MAHRVPKASFDDARCPRLTPSTPEAGKKNWARGKPFGILNPLAPDSSPGWPTDFKKLEESKAKRDGAGTYAVPLLTSAYRFFSFRLYLTIERSTVHAFGCRSAATSFATRD